MVFSRNFDAPPDGIIPRASQCRAAASLAGIGCLGFGAIINPANRNKDSMLPRSFLEPLVYISASIVRGIVILTKNFRHGILLHHHQHDCHCSNSAIHNIPVLRLLRFLNDLQYRTLSCESRNLSSHLKKGIAGYKGLRKGELKADASLCSLLCF
jgi:hypothetical protein